MSKTTLEQRIGRLEELFDDLVHGQMLGRDPGRDDWLKTVGIFAGDPVMKEIIAEGQRVREEDRQQTRT